MSALRKFAAGPRRPAATQRASSWTWLSQKNPALNRSRA
jgi:hypothetical protein